MYTLHGIYKDDHCIMHTQYNSNTNGNRGNDLNVVSAWIQGYTGKGIVVSVVDDGK